MELNPGPRPAACSAPGPGWAAARRRGGVHLCGRGGPPRTALSSRLGESGARGAKESARGAVADRGGRAFAKKMSAMVDEKHGAKLRCAPRRSGGTGRRARFRSVWGQPRGGSSPLFGTKFQVQGGRDRENRIQRSLHLLQWAFFCRRDEVNRRADGGVEGVSDLLERILDRTGRGRSAGPCAVAQQPDREEDAKSNGN